MGTATVVAMARGLAGLGAGPVAAAPSAGSAGLRV